MKIVTEEELKVLLQTITEVEHEITYDFWEQIEEVKKAQGAK